MKRLSLRRHAPWLFASLLLGACATKPRPPAFNLYVHTRIAVVPFVNASTDGSLAQDVQGAVVAEFRRLGAVPLAEAPAIATGEYLAGAEEGEAPVWPWENAGWRKEIAKETGCDLILAGTVGSYQETLAVEEPKRVKSRITYGWRWGWSEQGSVHLDGTMRLVDAKTGKVVWSRVVPGDGKQGRWTELDWPGETSSAPSEGWDALVARAAPVPASRGADGLLRGAESLVSAARAEAIAEFVRTLSTDFLGRDGWQPPAKQQGDRPSP